MRPFRDYPIARKLTWMNVLVSGAAVSLACIGFISYDVGVYRQNVTDNLASQALVIGTNTLSAVLFNDPLAAQNTLVPLSSAPSMVYVGVYTIDGKPFATYSRAKAVPPLALPPIPAGQTQTSWFANGEIGLVRLIMLDGKPAEYVYVRADQSILYQRLRRYAATSVLVLLGSILAALFVSATFRRSFAEPIVSLADLANTITREKDYSARAPSKHGRDEVATLVEAFNEMLTQIQKRDADLQTARNLLEKRVQERTAELRKAKENLRELSGQLMEIQDAEKRHLARELHDSTGQLLAALIMNLGVAAMDAGPASDGAKSAINTSLALAQEVTQQVRTMSYLLHPPLLDEEGLGSALRWFVAGFSQRSNIAVNLNIAPQIGRLPHEYEMTIFRIVQECLANVHRHSGSPSASVTVTRNSDEIRVVVRDEGKGMDNRGDNLRSGVGISGMRERANRLNGQLDIQSNSNGTTVSAVFACVAAATQLPA